MTTEPLIELAIQPILASGEKFATALQAISLQIDIEVRADHETGHFLLGGWSEEQLLKGLDLLREKASDEFKVSAPQVAYREHLTNTVDVDYTYKKQAGGSGEFGRVKVTIVPGERGSGFKFFDEIKGGNIPREYIPSIEKGFRETAQAGSLVGFPIIDFEVHLTDGTFHDIDSSALAFEICGRGAMLEAVQKSGIKILEPIMKVEVVTPEEYLGDVIDDLNRGVVNYRASTAVAKLSWCKH